MFLKRSLRNPRIKRLARITKRDRRVTFVSDEWQYFTRNKRPCVMVLLDDHYAPALIDTGSTNCQLTEEFASKLDLIEIGKNTTYGTNGHSWLAREVVIKSMIIRKTIFHNVLCEVTPNGKEIIIGMNILGQLDLTFKPKDKVIVVS